MMSKYNIILRIMGKNVTKLPSNKSKQPAKTKIVEPLLVDTIAAPRKRGRPRKSEIAREELLEASNSKGYTIAEEESLREFYKKAIDLFKIQSSKALMSRMHDIQQYIYKSREYGQLSLPFPPFRDHISE